MKFYQIDLSKIRAIAHDGAVPLGQLSILIQEEGTLEVKTVPAPLQALEGIRAIASLAAGEEINIQPTLPPSRDELLDNITMISTTSLRCQGSSNIAAIGYESSLKVLQIEFISGSTYRYFNVSFQKFADFIAANSAGRYFNAEIKSQYSSEKVN
ncbi:KTSC domain-containing protein [Gloeothece verrucosa]|uniref:KTSC domain-containing protein n=1 Tax=Gloeothece verrucosa (strain PCC 7822) TaxID=497965 RepID=E0UMQ3_GLOV7|nr:KTSC domain-containing protein [Gloeothece verrucosa]ADN18233.1 conserved hypothetical protein [Gloeothece verrucosa PCC 7822]